MDEPKLWIVGGVALLLVVSALIWVLRSRADAPAHVPTPGYGAPEVTLTGTARASGLTFGSNVAEDELVVDETVPLSRLGGAGWRDGGAVPKQTTTDAYAVESPSWADDEPASSCAAYEPQVEVDQTIPRSALSDDVDRDRGGHW